MVGVGEEDLKQKEKAQLNFTAEHDKEKTGFYLVVLLLSYRRLIARGLEAGSHMKERGMLVRKLENFRATLSDIFMGKTIGFPSQNEHFRHFHLGILSQD